MQVPGFLTVGLILLRRPDFLLQALFPAQARAVFKLPDWVKFAWFLVVGLILLRRSYFLLQALFLVQAGYVLSLVVTISH